MKEINIDKLPKYAIEYIESLKRELKSKDNHIQTLKEEQGLKKTDIYYYVNGSNWKEEDKIYINANSVFIEYEGLKVEMCIYDGDIMIFGNNPIDIKPMASNHILIKRRD